MAKRVMCGAFIFCLLAQPTIAMAGEPMWQKLGYARTGASITAIVPAIITFVACRRAGHAFDVHGCLNATGSFICGLVAHSVTKSFLYGLALRSALRSLESHVPCLQTMDRNRLQEILTDARYLEGVLADRLASTSHSKRIAKVIEAVQAALAKAPVQ